jgi:hypothetical protein
MDSPGATSIPIARVVRRYAYNRYRWTVSPVSKNRSTCAAQP